MNVTNTTQRNSISVWFVCKSCEFTFSFPTVDEFLEHKKEKHLVEFQKAQCIVFEERKQDEFFVRTDEDEETKLFAQDDDDDDRYVVVELCPGSGTSELLTETAQPLSPAAPLPVPKPILPPDKLSPRNTAIQTKGAAALEEKSRHEYEFNGDLGLFSSRFNTSDDPRDLPGDVAQCKSSESQLVQSHVDVKNDTTDWSPENLCSDPDFSVADSDADSDDSNVEDLIDPLSDNLLDTPSNSTLTNCLNPTLKNPFVLLRRLTAKELASWSSKLIVSSNPSNKRKVKSSKKKRKPKRRESGGPFLCTICSSPFGNKTARGLHMRSHFETQSGPRPFSCSYPDCTASFRQAYILDRHKARHEKGKLNPKFKSVVNKVFFCFPEPQSENQTDPLTLREWLCEQKKLSEKNSNSSQTETETDPGNFILLYPDLTAMDKKAAEAFKISRETPVQCRLCGQKLESAPHVKVHATHCWLRNKGRHRYCFPCNLVLSSRKTLKQHNRNKHSLVKKIVTPEYSCPLCPRKTRTQAYLKHHMKAHARTKEERKAKTWVCEICGSAYSQQCLLNHHQRSHGEETPFKCPHPGCASAFKTKPNLTSHLRRHRIRSKNFSCPREGCSKSFKTKNELTIHLKSLSHSGVSRPGPKMKSWKCEHENCGKWFPDIPALNRHRISAHGVTTELPTFECHICGKTFTYKISLTRHVWAHTNDCPFKCTYEGCAKTFNYKNTLAEHIYKHTGERPYQCDLCGKDYNARASFNRHLAWHQRNSNSEADRI